jgi:colicin import membrane protein
MTVRIFIDTSGKLSRKKTERSSGDRAFEISVLRAIDTASEKFTPPPNRKVFEGVFVFKREGISPNKL